MAATSGGKQEFDGIPIPKHVLIAILKWLAGIFIAGWMTTAIWIGTEILARLDKSELRLANLEQLNSTQNTTIAVIQNDLKRQTEQQEILIKNEGDRQIIQQATIDKLKDQMNELRVEIERLKK